MDSSELTTYTHPSIEVQEPLVAIGDLHGHYPALETLLDGLTEHHNLIEEDKLNGTLVFTGDYIDRGTSAIPIIERIMALQEANPNQVYTLAGNHELMALGDLDFARIIVEAMQRGTFQPDQAFSEYLTAGFAGMWHGRNGGLEFINEFGDDPYEAFNNYATRMDAQGDIGSWMRSLHPAFKAKVAGKKFLFTHSDIPQSVATRSGIQKVIRDFRQHMALDSGTLGGTRMKYGKEIMSGKNSIFWDRRFRRMAPEEFDKLRADLKVDYVVVGHTPHDEIRSYSNIVFDIDVGMTPKYGEREPAALVVNSDGIFGFYAERGVKRLVTF